MNKRLVRQGGMKHSLDAAPVVLQQADKQARGASVVVVACAFTVSREKAELDMWICLGEALKAKASSCKEVIELVTPALPITCGSEHEGTLCDLSEALAASARPAVLTIEGSAFLALLSSTVVFDSCCSSEGGKAVVLEFETADHVNNYLLGHFEHTAAFSLCEVQRRAAVAPRTFGRQELAFQLADTLPPGLFHVFARDRHADSGSKEYQVAGLDDFYEYYMRLPPDQRTHYDVARAMRPLTFHADLEFDIGCGNNAVFNGPNMLEAFIAQVGGPVSAFVVYDSSSDTKVSYHVHNHTMWYADCRELAEFMRRVERDCGGLRVERKAWDAKQHVYVIVNEFFADQSVYTPNRCFRLCYSTKKGKNRPFQPLTRLDECAAFFGSLVSPISARLYTATGLEQEGMAAASSSSDIIPMEHFPKTLDLLVSAVVDRFKPEQMRGFQMTPLGLITFPMVNHDCEICNDRHNNQTYVVADLKRRVFWQKCHSDRTKAGAEVPFPPGSFCLVLDSELDVARSEFPSDSTSARLILTFVQAVYASSRTAPQIPQPGTVAVMLNAALKVYQIPLPGRCPVDSGVQQVEVTLHKTTIRCKGRQCQSKGKRWDRPSHSSNDAGRWDLRYLFPAAAAATAATAAAAAGGGSGEDFPEFACGTPELFIDEPNFFRALGCEDDRQRLHRIYAERLHALSKWNDFTHALFRQVQSKVDIMTAIMLNDAMVKAYYECLLIAPDFSYPLQLLPKGPISLAIAVFNHLAKRRGFKRSEDNFYVPVTDAQGRSYYRVVSQKKLLTSVCTFETTPNLCASIIWNGRVCEDISRMLADENEFPSLPISKRYMGFSDFVYDMEDNVALAWEEVRQDPSVMPFNFLDRPFPVDLLEQAKAQCPVVRIEGGTVHFDGLADFVPTPLFDQTLLDQTFKPVVMMWLFVFIGRMFHDVGKSTGDNWEIIPFLIGAPGTFKSSIVSIVQSYFQADQVGVIATKVESQFPISSLVGKLVVVMTECGGCTLDRDLLKLMASGDPVTASTKHQSAILVPSWNIPTMFAGNSMLDFRDTDGSSERRGAVFPFTAVLQTGQGIVDLVSRIVKLEGAALLIKCNSMYLAVKKSVRQPIHPLLPPEIREATRQALMENDSLRSFIAQDCVTGDAADRVPWQVFLGAYQKWCKAAGYKPYPVDPFMVEIQTMFRRIGVRLSRNRTLPITLVGIRPRAAGDPPYRSVFEVRYVRRAGGVDDDEMEGSSAE